jgi:Domain of unknown function DUF11
LPAPASITDLGLSGAYVAGANGGTITWQVTNLGSMDAKGVVLVEGLPASAQIQSITTSGGSCTQSSVLVNVTHLECDLGILPQGKSWTVTVAIVSSASSAKTAARVRFNGTDPVTANNYYLLTMLHNASASGGGSVSPPPARPIHNLAVRKRSVSDRRISGPQD